MNLKIGETIKNLRAERRVTQEQLSSFLGVTPQAISRWEAGNGYPDIETLPFIAEFFGISTDLLLGIDRSDRERRRREIYLEMQRDDEGDWDDDSVRRARQYVAEFPYDERILENLACRLTRSMWDEAPDMNELSEAERMYETLIEMTKDGELRNSALEQLASLYAVGFKDSFKLQRTLLRLPAMGYCREQVAASMSTVTHGDLYPIQDYIEKLTDSLGSELDVYITQSLPGGPETWERKIEMLEFVISLYKFVFGEDLLFYNDRVARIYQHISVYKLYAEKHDEALDTLETMCCHIEARNNVKAGDKFDSPFTNTISYPENIVPFGEFHTTIVHNYAWYTLNDRLTDKVFDPIRDNGRFKAVVERLTKIAY